MHKTAKGWYLATLPGHVMKPGDLQIYFDARDANDKEIASNGQVDSPSIVEIRKKGGGGRRGEGDEEDPLKRIRNQQRDEAYEAGLHRRREGAFWFGVGGGVGWGYSPAGSLEWEKDLKVSAITTTTGLFHLLPELGYMWSDSFGIALQVRYEVIQQQQATYIDKTVSDKPQLASTGRDGAPTTQAFATFARAIWYTDLSSSGNMQFSVSGDLGGGFVRFPVKPVAVVQGYNPDTGAVIIDPRNTIAKTDTRPVGPVLFGSTVGIIAHLSRHFALSLDARLLSGLGDFGVVVEGGLNAQIALGGKAGPAPEGDEGDEEGGGGDGGPGNDAPAPDESSSDEGE
jgi:hypothetical protein